MNELSLSSPSLVTLTASCALTHLFFEEERSGNDAINNQEPVQEVADNRIREKNICRTNRGEKYLKVFLLNFCI